MHKTSSDIRFLILTSVFCLLSTFSYIWILVEFVWNLEFII